MTSQIKNNIYLYFTTFVQIVGAYVFTNKNGVTINYVINFKSKCRAEDGRIAILQGLPIAECVAECGLRQHCASLNYRTRGHDCELFSSAEEGDVEKGDCIFIPASDITIQEIPCVGQDCSNGKTCDSRSKTCTHKECSNNMVLQNGKIHGNLMRTGSRIRYTCDSGYEEKNGIKNADCLETGQWNRAAECVTASLCGNPPTIDDGDTSLDPVNSSIASVLCDAGYQSTNSTINCIPATRSWESVTCERIACGNLPTINNGNAILVVEGSNLYLDTASVSCNDGYQHSVGTITCTSTGSWETTSCDRKSCGSLPLISNGNIALNIPNGNKYLDLATVTCDVTYVATKTPISCTAAGTWEAVSCDLISCGNLPTINNGNAILVIDGSNLYLDTASVSCDTGYQRSVDTITCISTGSWETASCDRKSCGNLPSLSNGNIVLNTPNGNKYLDLATVTCDVTYVATKTPISCTAAGTWEAVSCDLISCGNPQAISNGNIELDTVGSYQYLDTASVSCVTGYQSSVGTITCTSTGSWETANCERKSCGNLPTINNGNAILVIDGSNLYLDAASVSCNTGYQSSVGTITCTSTGSWETASCNRKSCGSLPLISNGNIVLNIPNGNKYLDLATVTCDVTYIATKNPISCTAAGNWEAVSCDLISCGNPQAISNGNIELDTVGSYQYLDTASVSCITGYQSSVGTITCTSTGSWETATCERKSCGNPQAISNGNIELDTVGSYQYFDTASVSCVTGYQSSVGTITCTSTGNWETATCERKSCGNLPTINNGNAILVIDGSNLYLDTASVSCDTGYESSVSTITCTSTGSWETASCDRKSCGNPQAISNGNIELDTVGSYRYLDTASVSCDTGYQSSVGTITCTSTGSWETATCERKSCGNLPSIANGQYVPDSGYLYQDTATVSCDDWFQADVHFITCTESGSWTQASCTDVQCYPGTPWEYQGKISYTKTGRLCQRWDSQSPHPHSHTDLQYFPEATLAEASNYCRNPEAGEYNPWCMTTDPDKEWEYCSITPCD